MTQPVIRRARERRTIILAQSSLLDDRRPAQESRSLVPPWLSLTPPAWMYVRQRPARRRPELAQGRARRKISELRAALDGAEFFTPGARRAAGRHARAHASSAPRSPG